MDRSARPALVALAVCALAGTIFAAVSTFDFVAHLDRQWHTITCSFIPGLAAADSSGASGCHAVMMSPWSSVLRTWTWGGIPIALPALSVFLFLLAIAVEFLLRRDGVAPDEATFLLAATALPVAMTVIYFAISMILVGAACKLCIGIYVASIGAFAAAWVLRRTPAARGAGATAGFGLRALEGVAFVVLPLAIYLAAKPAYPAGSACGELLHAEDRHEARLKLGGAGGVPAVELLDPLCPACRAMSQRLSAGGFDRRLALEVVLFPLDKDCNWMVKESVHPGACAASEALLCAGGQLDEVLRWVFRHQSELHELGRENPARVAARITQQFPQLAGCVGKPEVKAKLNRSLRWAVSNSLPVLTPQLFVAGQKVCDEDTDLGLDYVLARTLASPRAARRAALGTEATR